MNLCKTPAKIKAYEAKVETGALPTHRGLQLSQDDLIRQYAIADLMCNFQLDFSVVKLKFQVECSAYFEEELAALASLAQDKLLSIEPGIVRITELGKNFVRNIAMTFDAYLKREGKTPKIQYSKTI